MKCKYCDCELVEGKRFCPACGKDQEEAVEVTEAPAEAAEAEIKESAKATPGKIALAIAAGVAVLALLIALVISGVDGDLFKGNGETLPSEEATAPTEETVPPTTPPDGNPDDVTCKGTYTVSDDEIYAAADTVVATIGDEKLTNGLLQAYYWDGVYAFLQENGSYAGMLGLNFSQGLDTQLCAVGDVSMTWQQYFLDSALKTWHSHMSMALEGKDHGYELSGELLEAKNNLAPDMEELAKTYGYEDMAEFVHAYIGPGCSFEDYLTYMEVYYRGYGYFNHIYDHAVFTAEEVEAYFTENAESYASEGITRDSGKYVDVRHILLSPEGGTTDENGNTVYSDAEWEACRAAAQEILDQWLAGDATEDSFAELANTHSTDPGSNTNGGLYEGVYEGQMVPEFNDWCFDEARVYGDSGLVKTSYGYHIMFFVGSQDIWYVTAEQDLISSEVSAVMPEAMEKHPMEVDYGAIKLGLVEFSEN